MVQVYWNGTKVPIKDFKAYCGLYLGPDPKVCRTSEEKIQVAGSCQLQCGCLHACSGCDMWV
jgi:hypothetical protein